MMSNITTFLEKKGGDEIILCFVIATIYQTLATRFTGMIST